MDPLQATSLLSNGLQEAERAGGIAKAEDAQAGSQLLLKELEYLPLAISQAAAYIRLTRTDVAEYLASLQEEQQRWDVLAANFPDRYRRSKLPNSVFRTWGISIKQIQRESPASYRILCVITFIDNQNIPFNILSAASGLEDARRVQIRRAIARLQDFSFLGQIRTSQGEVRYEMHKLVQEATLYHLRTPSNDSTETRQSLAHPKPPDDGTPFVNEALRILTELFPETNLSSGGDIWDHCAALFPHAARVTDAIDSNYNQFDSTELLRNLSSFLVLVGRLRELEGVREKLLRFNLEHLGEKHPNTLASMANLASTYERQKKLTEAADMMETALARQIEEFGESHPASFKFRSRLADIRGDQGRHDEARQLLDQMLRSWKEERGDRQFATIDNVLNLVESCHRQGRFKEAEELEIEIFHTFRQELGEKHPSTLHSMWELAQLHQSQGQYGRAEELLSKAFQTAREALGPAHALTLTYMMSAGSVLTHMGRVSEGEKKISDALDTMRLTLGEEHQLTVMCKFNLALAWYWLRRYDEAIHLMQERLLFLQHAYEPEHLGTLLAVKTLDQWEHDRDAHQGTSGLDTSE